MVQHLRGLVPENNGQPRPHLGQLGLELRGEGGLPRGKLFVRLRERGVVGVLPRRR